MPQRFRLVSLLADGRFHSGEELGRALGVGRAAVWKLVKGIEAWGLEVFAVSGRGYRLSEPLELLDRALILADMRPEARVLLAGLDVLPGTDSTNRNLMERAAQGLASGFACLAEHQWAGRGRQGRDWISPFGANLYLSVLWRFEDAPAALASLSLAAAVAVARALADMGVQDIGLKWPNDILWQERKLSGILLEMAGEPAGPCYVVAGVGLNVNMPPASGDLIDQSWVDLRGIVGRPLARNPIAAGLLSRLLEALETFSHHGLSPFRAEWRRLDCIQGRTISISSPGGGAQQGTALGTDESGALRVDVDGHVRRFHSGEVSVRTRP